jgi:hypothetical protein
VKFNTDERLGKERCSQCPFLVNRVVLTARPSLPVYPEQRTLSDRLGMSQRCHNGRRLLQSLVKGPVFRLSWFTCAAIVVVAGTVRAAGQLFRYKRRAATESVR